MATAVGVLLTLHPGVAGICGLVWGGVFYGTRYASLAALVAAGVLPIVAFFLGDKPFFYFTFFCTALVFSRHHSNIRRLIQGKESKVGTHSEGK